MGAQQTGERGEWAAVRNPTGMGPEAMCRVCRLSGNHAELRGRCTQATGCVRTDGATIALVAGTIRGCADDVRGEELPDCGHWVAEEVPDLLVQKLFDFFGTGA